MNMRHLKDNSNLIAIGISTLVILGTFCIAWGSVQAQLVNLDKRVTFAEEMIRAHHEDTARHVDSQWKDNVTNQLQEIRRLITEHMANSIPRKEPLSDRH